MSWLPPLVCVRCGAMGLPDDRYRYLGCSRCHDDVPANYRWEGAPERVPPLLNRNVGAGMWRFADALPVADPVTLGEGDTPLLALDRLGAEIGVPHLFAKNESVNPTWSHKDRLASVTVAAAREMGARVVAAASTGNHGAAVAAYAARAGLRCVVATLASVPPTMKELMVGYGAEVVATRTSEERYTFIADGVDRHGWYPASNITAPAVGSDAYGIAGYKTIAYELVEQFGGAPEWVVMPVAYGDCLAGVAQGFAELTAAGVIPAAPCLVGAELFGALEHALGGGNLGPAETHPSAAFSIAGSYTTYQAVAALQLGGGFARSVSEDEIAEARHALGVLEGLSVEAAAAAPFAVARALAGEGVFGEQDRVVCLLTSTGLKDLGGSAAVPTIEPDLLAFRDLLRDAGRLDAVAEAELFGPPSP